ncbi:large conductance mechanosensitive channel protein MscL [Pseudonocardia nematodicida]|uniref:Large-conductance mechanosensitive channel n=1 Tax=Pseudonocardia nematodicida TaxID=1206997 RepID=A0ABV1KD83_9PSEU
MIKGFRDFVMRGNVVDLAVAVVIGAAFTSVVTAFTDSFLTPLIRVFSGGGELAGAFAINGVVFDWAAFVNALITFLITAAVVYFLVVLPLNTFAQRRRRAVADEPAAPTEIELLTEIRDLLREERAAGRGAAGDPATGA